MNVCNASLERSRNFCPGKASVCKLNEVSTAATAQRILPLDVESRVEG